MLRTVRIKDGHAKWNDKLVFSRTRQLRIYPNGVVDLQREVVARN